MGQMVGVYSECHYVYDKACWDVFFGWYCFPGWQLCYVESLIKRVNHTGRRYHHCWHWSKYSYNSHHSWVYCIHQGWIEANLKLFVCVLPQASDESDYSHSYCTVALTDLELVTAWVSWPDEMGGELQENIPCLLIPQSMERSGQEWWIAYSHILIPGVHPWICRSASSLLYVIRFESTVTVSPEATDSAEAYCIWWLIKIWQAVPRFSLWDSF
jgi:hypothetical protein